MRKYEKMSQFVDEMNASVSVVGDMSVYLFNRFRVFVGFLFVVITAVSIAFITSEFIRGFQLQPIFGVNVYYIVLFSALILGGYLASFGEDAKISTVKGIIFSTGSNRFWQFIASIVIITVLIMINSKGVQKIADFSLRYMNTELENSVVYKLKNQKIQTHARLATVRSSVGISDTSIKALQQSREDMITAKKNEIQAIKNASENYIKGRDKRAYRTLIANKRVETARLISKLEDKWAKKIAKLDWKLQKAEEKINDRISSANRLRTKEVAKADEATNELIKYYEDNSNQNQKVIDKYKGIGLIVAVAGEIIDGVLAFVLFMIVKSNPNNNGVLKVAENTREIATLKNFQNKVFSKNSFKREETNSHNFHLKHQEKSLSTSLFQQIKRESEMMAKEKNELLNIEGISYLNHPTQRELIRRFKRYNINITPIQIGEYFHKMGDEIYFINQKMGFVYAKENRAVA